MKQKNNPADERGQRAALTLVSGTLFSRLLGFARDLIFAFLLGPAADAFLVAFRLPNMIRRLLAEGALGLSYGAAAGRLLVRSGPGALPGFGREVLIRLVPASLLLTLLVAVLAGPIVSLLAPGLAPETLAYAASLLRLCALYLPCGLVAAIACAHAGALGDFRPQAWSSALFNILVIAAALAALALFNPQEALFPVHAGRALCFGVLLAGVAQAGAALRAAVARSPKALPDEDGRQEAPSSRPEALALLRALPRDVAGAAPHVIQVIAGTILASFLAEGGVSALYFAERLVELPLGLFGAALGLAALPGLAAMAEAGDGKRFSRSLGNNIRLTAFFSLPATAGLFALSLPLCSLLFGHGAYDSRSVATTAAMLSGSCLGLPALCASRPLVSAANALGAGGASLRAAWLSLAPLALSAVAGLALFGGESRKAAFCLGLGLALAAWTNALLLLRLPGLSGPLRGLPPPLSGQGRALFAYALGAAAMGAGLILLQSLAGPFSSGALLLLVAGCAALWGGGALLLGNEDARLVWKGIKER